MNETFKRLDKLVEPKDAPDTKTAEPQKEAAKEPAEPKVEATDPTKTNGDTKPSEPAKDGKKPNPWKLYEEQKELRAKVEAENLRLSKLIQKPEEREAEVKRVSELEAQNKQLLEHIRFVDYQQHPEFKEKYDKPYTEAWNKIIRRLSGVTVDAGDGQRRPVEPKDIAAISRLPADQAIELAEQKFGKLGPWVAERVEELRSLDEAKYEALERAKKEGLTRQQQLTEAQQLHEKKINDFLAETWQKATSEIESHSRYAEYFKPKEGDDEYNARLESGAEKVNKYWGKSPKDPSLTPEQKADVVKGHAAIWNRARAFGVQQLVIERQKSEIERLSNELKKFTASVPQVDGSQPANPANGQPADPWQRSVSILGPLR